MSKMSKDFAGKDTKGGRDWDKDSHFGRSPAKLDGPVNMRKAMAMGHNPLGKEPNMHETGGKMKLNTKAKAKNDY